jgi:hypothetical protein
MTLSEFIIILSAVAIPTIVYGWRDARSTAYMKKCRLCDAVRKIMVSLIVIAE